MDLFTVRRLEKILDGYISLKVPHNVRSSVRLSYEWNGNNVWASVDSIARDPDFERQLEQVEVDREGLFWPT